MVNWRFVSIHRHVRCKACLMMGVFVVCIGSPVVADTLQANVHNDTILPGEPIFLNIALTLDRPILAEGDPRDVALDSLRLRRKLKARLFEKNAEVARISIHRLDEFNPIGASQTEFTAPFAAFLIASNAEGEYIPFFDRAGRYRVEIGDPQNADTVPCPGFSVTIRRPRGEEVPSVNEMARLGLQPLGDAVFNDRCSDECIAAMKHVAAAMPDTVIGQSAAIIVARSSFDDVMNRRLEELNEGEMEALISQLQRVAEKQSPGIPLYQGLMKDLAEAQIRTERYDDATATIDTLEREYPGAKADGTIDGLRRSLHSMRQSNQKE